MKLCRLPRASSVCRPTVSTGNQQVYQHALLSYCKVGHTSHASIYRKKQPLEIFYTRVLRNRSYFLRFWF
jgi:hypothetical protein